MLGVTRREAALAREAALSSELVEWVREGWEMVILVKREIK